MLGRKPLVRHLGIGKPDLFQPQFRMVLVLIVTPEFGVDSSELSVELEAVIPIRSRWKGCVVRIVRAEPGGSRERQEFAASQPVSRAVAPAPLMQCGGLFGGKDGEHQILSGPTFLESEKYNIA